MTDSGKTHTRLGLFFITIFEEICSSLGVRKQNQNLKKSRKKPEKKSKKRRKKPEKKTKKTPEKCQKWLLKNTVFVVVFQ